MRQFQQTAKYLFPIALILLATLAKYSFTGILGNRTPFLLYSGVVIGATWYSGWRIGLLTNFICLLLVVYLFLEPIGSFYIQPRLYVHLLIFTLQNVLVALMGYALQEALRKSRAAESKVKLLLEEACDLLVLRNENGKAIYVSPKVTEITGYTPEEYMELTFDRLVEPEHLEMFKEKIESVMAKPNERQTVKSLFRCKNGGLKWLEGDVYNYLERPGINAIVSHIKDVTSRIQLETQKDEFIGMASHELKTPITNIKGFTTLAKSAIRTNPEKAEALLGRSEVNIKRLGRLVNDLLDISKINTGRLSYEFQLFNLSSLIQEVVQSFILTYPGHTFTLETVPLAIINGDRFRLEQVITNLIDNAIKYSPESRSIVIKQELKEGKAIVSVQDFGIGISEEHLKHIFDRFYRVDASSMRFQGLGLGLFIASDILKNHKGNFWVESKQGEGSTFFFIVPLQGYSKELAVTDHATFYHNSSISIHYHSKENYLEVKWIGIQTKETVNESGLKILEFVRKTKATRVYNDNSEVIGNWSDTSDHGGKVWFPAMAEVGVSFFAWVMSKDRFSNMAAMRSYDMNKSNILIKLFDRQEEAVSWLLEQEVDV
ncbi:ATP-binding protein [Desertivirga arenae]|uniref:ATP-binding protein n=1 Tax=Desertivirga arenae TaxID=2810309 RepID=UPI001A95F50D|nr:ATP-binding protein [Pedobacter sp. SYSU D00823]